MFGRNKSRFLLRSDETELDESFASAEMMNRRIVVEELLQPSVVHGNAV